MSTPGVAAALGNISTQIEKINQLTDDIDRDLREFDKFFYHEKCGCASAGVELVSAIVSGVLATVAAAAFFAIYAAESAVPIPANSTTPYDLTPEAAAKANDLLKIVTAVIAVFGLGGAVNTFTKTIVGCCGSKKERANEKLKQIRKNAQELKRSFDSLRQYVVNLADSVRVHDIKVSGELVPILVFAGGNSDLADQLIAALKGGDEHGANRIARTIAASVDSAYSTYRDDFSKRFASAEKQLINSITLSNNAIAAVGQQSSQLQPITPSGGAAFPPIKASLSSSSSSEEMVELSAYRETGDQETDDGSGTSIDGSERS